MTDKVLERRKIHELPKQMADKIAAGEVVDRPLSIVKELVENSIDAGATSIVVEIQNGGKTYIRVTDNGCGIPADETELAFRRHATSKLQDIKDLDAIETLGFRGEALASISAVSRVELITKTAQEEAGTSAEIAGGITVSSGSVGCPEGTTIIVRDLFFNTPARLKFLKKDSAESGLIIDFVSKIALAYPSIRIRLINNGNTLFSTQGRGDMFGTIATIYDPAMAKKLIHFRKEAPEGLTVEGYISSPDETRANRKNQIFFVNGRYIHSKILEQSISDGYREKLFEGRYPIAFLFLQISPEQIDVNIHPNKKEIRFHNEDLVREAVTGAVREALRVPEAVAEFTFQKDRVRTENQVTSWQQEKAKKPAAQKQEQLDMRTLLRQKRAEETAASYGKPKELSPASSASAAPAAAGETGHSFAPKVIPAQSRPFDVNSIRPMGTLFASYILGCDDSNFYMVDQHAAHERVFYERLVREFYHEEHASQILGIPMSISVSHAVSSREEEWMEFLSRIGFEAEAFGPKSYAIKAIPAYMSEAEARMFVQDFFDGLDEPGALRDRRRREKIITKACKSAVKANDRLSTAEIAQLLKDLAACENPFSCPHGRPTIIRMKKTEIEALFKR
ncbi:MAG: DNA mismatch repair endonuclease MutL [Anaerovoracaceae bacterium]